MVRIQGLEAPFKRNGLRSKILEVFFQKNRGLLIFITEDMWHNVFSREYLQHISNLLSMKVAKESFS
jgi:hypothetical protein